MKKVLLGTTAMVGASLIAVGAANAQGGPTVKIGGYSDFEYNWVDEDNIDDATREFRDYGSRMDIELHFELEYTADNGLTYGAHFEADAGQTLTTNTGAFDDTYLFFKSPSLGTIHFGRDESAIVKLAVTMPRGFGSGGADGDFEDINLGTTTGDLVNSDMSIGDAQKFTFLSPKFGGFDFGISYNIENDFQGEDANSLASGIRLQAVSGVSNSASNLDNVVQVGLRYSGKFDVVGVKAGVGFARGTWEEGRTGSVSSSEFEDLNGYQGGLSLSYGGFTVGGSYVYLGDSGLEETGAPSKEDHTAWGAGIQYSTGPWTVGFNTLHERLDVNAPDIDYSETDPAGTVAAVQAAGGEVEDDIYAVGFKYGVAPGLGLYGEVGWGEIDVPNDGGALDNDYTWVTVGTHISF